MARAIRNLIRRWNAARRPRVAILITINGNRRRLT